MSRLYDPYDDRTQMARYIDRYPLSFKRTPLTPLVSRLLTLSELTGPAGSDLFALGPMGHSQIDLSKTSAEVPRATGQLIQISGRVTDEDGSPLAGAAIEIWQANSAGKYIHDADRHNAPIDPNFTGEGRLVTDAEGNYQFFTIKPGAYPVLESGWWWRPPHIHFSILGKSWMDRFVTQIFFPGEPLNETDLLLNGVSDREARERLIFQFQGTTMTEGPSAREVNAIQFRQDFVLRGRRQTPELD
jgi:protocatechuate 3,4-dioxygenase beta subunit